MKYNQSVRIKKTGERTVVKIVIKQNGKIIAVRVYNYKTGRTDRYDIEEIEID